MPNLAAELVILRNEFYQRSYKQIKLIVSILILISILLVGFAVHQRVSLKPMPKYFPTTPSGALIISPPRDINHLILSQQKVDPTTGIIYGMPPPVIPYADLVPDGENALIIYWATMAIKDMLDYDYVHYRSVIQEASKYFTPVGHRKFIKALIDSRNLETIKARSAVVIPQVTGKAQILGTRMIDGRFAWDVQMPVQLTFESVRYQTPIIQNLTAKMSIARVSTLVCPFYGLAIFQLNFEEVLSKAS
jgi:hypothetical protein